jgi:uncharacterized protein (TIGR03437 family)
LKPIAALCVCLGFAGGLFGQTLTCKSVLSTKTNYICNTSTGTLTVTSGPDPLALQGATFTAIAGTNAVGVPFPSGSSANYSGVALTLGVSTAPIQLGCSPSATVQVTATPGSDSLAVTNCPLLDNSSFTTTIDFTGGTLPAPIPLPFTQQSSTGSVTYVCNIGAICFPPLTAFVGAGLNDATYNGTYSGASPQTYCVAISSAGATDQFTAGTTAPACTGILGPTNLSTAAITIQDGVTIQWAATTGHTVGNYWTLNAGAVTDMSISNGKINATCYNNGALTCSSALSLNPSTGLTFNYQTGGTAPGSQSVGVTDSPTVSLAYALTTATSSGGNWLSVTPAGADTGTGFSVSVNPSPGGTPLAVGQYKGTVNVYSAVSNTLPVVENVTFNVTSAPITITTPSVPNGEVGAPYSTTLAATGGVPPYSNWTVSSGTLPPGLSLNSSSGQITGTPNTTTGSPFTFSVTVKDSVGTVSAPKQFSNVTIIAGPSVTPATLPGGEVGATYTPTTLGATGGTPPYSNWTVSSGSLPAGLTLSSSTGQITGTPTAAGTPSFFVTVKDSAGSTSSAQQFSIAVIAGPTITPATLPGGEVGATYTPTTLGATGGTPPYSNWTVSSGSLPAGLTLSSSTGQITGTPTTVGTPTFFVTVKDSVGSTSSAQQFSIAVIAGPTITPATLPGGEVGAPYTPTTLVASGGTPPYSNWTVSSGSLPPGLTLSSSSGQITGTPSTVTGSPFSFSVTVKDNAGSTSPQLPLSIAVIAGPTITPASLPNGSVGASYSTGLAATGGTPPYSSWTVSSGSLPPGLSLNAGTGVISGTPSTATGSPFSFFVTVKDNAGSTSLAVQFSIAIGTGVTITTSSLSGGEVGVSYSQTLGAIGGTPPYINWTVSTGSLPAGLSLNASSGVISGTPMTATGTPTPTFTVTVQDSASHTSAPQTLSIAIVAGPTITTATLPGGEVGVSYSQILAASNGTPPYSNWTVSGGSLPAGLSLNASSGVISGTPMTATGTPTPTFSVTVKDSVGATSSPQTLSIAVIAGPTITTITLPGGEVGLAYSQTLTATGGTGTYSTWTVSSGSLPAGLTLNATTGAITGTPMTATGTPTPTFSVTVKDSAGSTSPPESLSIAITAGVTVTTTSLPNGTAGVAYSQTLAATGGTPPYSNWTVSSGSLPAGLSLSASTGAISGTPTTATVTPTPSFNVTVKDSAGAISPAKTLSITIVPALSITTVSLPNGVLGTAYSQTLTATGGTPPYSNWTIATGSLPPGLSLNSSSGLISGTPTTAGGYPFTASVKDSAGNTATSATITLTVTKVSITITYTGNYVFNLPNTSPPITNTVTISASDGSAQPFTLAAGPSTAHWMTFSPTSGTTPATILLTATPAGLAPGVYPAPLEVTAPGTATNPTTIPVSLTVTGANLAATPSSLTFTYQPGGAAPAVQTLTLTPVVGNGPIALTSVASNVSWLRVSSAVSAPATLQVSVLPTGLTPATYAGEISISAAGSPSPSLVVPVTLTVSSLLQLTATPSSLSFDYQIGGQLPAAQTFTLSTNDTTVGVTVTSPGTWFSTSFTAGNPDTVTVTVNPAGLGPGTYGTTIDVSAVGASNVAAVPISLTVSNAGQLEVTPSQLSFTAALNGPAPASQAAMVTTGGAPVNFTATATANWLSVTPTSGTTPAALSISVNPAGLQNGTYIGSVLLAPAVVSNGRRTAVPTGGGQMVTVTFKVGTGIGVGAPTIAGVINAASGVLGTVSPGMIISVFGTALGPQTGAVYTVPPAGGTVATTLSGTQVLFDGVPVPLLYTQADQVNAIASFNLAGKASTVMQVAYNGLASAGVTLKVVPAEPGLFTANDSGTGQGAILNENASENNASNPAVPGKPIMLFGTGGGVTVPPSTDGSFNPLTAADTLALNVTVTIGGQPATVNYFGPAPGLVAGVIQINAVVPSSTPSGPADVVVTINNVNSLAGVTVAVQ